MKSVKTVILRKTKLYSNIFYNFALTGARYALTYPYYMFLGSIQFKKGKRSFWKGECSISAKELREYLKESYTKSKGVFPYK